MNPNVEKLIEALNSGKYTQAMGRLHIASDDKYCCLGVACEIAELGNWILEGTENFYYDIKGAAERSDTLAISYLPEEVQNYYNFTDHMAGFTPTASWIADLSDVDQARFNDALAKGHSVVGQNTSLVHMNDGGVPFENIAWVISLNPPGLFTSEGTT